MPKHTSSSAIVEPNGTTGAPPHPLFDTVHDHSGANEEQKRSPPPAFAIDDSEASSLSSPFSLRSHKLRQAQFAVFQSFPPSSGGLSGPGVTPELGGSGRTGYFTVPEDAEGEALFGPLPGSGTRGWSAYPSPSLPLHAEPQQPAVQHVERGEAASPLHGVKRSISPEERRRLKEQYGLKEEQQAKLERLLGAVWGSASAGEAKRFGEANSPLAPSSPLANRRDLGHSNKNAALPDSPPATTSSQRSERRRREQQQSTTIESVLADATPRPGDPLTGRSTRMNGEEPFFTPSVAKHLADEEAQVPSAPSRSPRPFPQTYPDGHSPRIVITTPLHSPRAKTLASPGASNRSSPRPASLHLSPPPSVDYDDPPRQQTTSPAISPPTSPQAERTLTPFPTPPPFFAPSFPDPYYTRPSNFRQLGYDFLPSRSGVRVSNHRGYVDGEMSQEEREWTERTRRVPNDGGLKDWWGNPVGERGQWGRAVLSPIVTETEPTHSSPSLSLNRSPHLHHFRPIAFPSSPLAERLRSLSTPPQPAPLSASTSSVSASPAARQPHSPVERYLSNSPLANGVVSPAADEAGEGLDGVRPLDTRRRDPLATEHPPSSGGGRGPSLGSATPSSASTPRLANSTPQPAAAIYSHSSGTALAEAQPKVRSASASIASPPGQALANARSSIASPVVQPQERLTTASPPSVSASKVEQISSWARGVHGEEGGDARRSWEGQPGDETVETERRRGLQPYSDGVSLSAMEGDASRSRSPVTGRRVVNGDFSPSNSPSKRSSPRFPSPLGPSAAPPFPSRIPRASPPVVETAAPTSSSPPRPSSPPHPSSLFSPEHRAPGTPPVAHAVDPLLPSSRPDPRAAAPLVPSPDEPRPSPTGRSAADVAAWARQTSRAGGGAVLSPDSPISVAYSASPRQAEGTKNSMPTAPQSRSPPFSHDSPDPGNAAFSGQTASPSHLAAPRGPDFAGEGGQLSMDALLPNRPAGAISPPLHNFHSSAFSPPRSPSKRSSSSRRVADPVLGFADGGKHLDAFSDPASLDEHETQRQQMRGIDERFRSAYSSSDLGASEPVFLEHGNGAFSPSSFAAGGSRRPLRPYRRGPFPVPQLSEEEKEERRRLRKLGRSPEFELDLSETKAELRKRAWKEQQAFEKQKNHLLGLLGEQPSRADVPVYNALARLHLATTVPASRALAQQYLLSSLAMDEAQPDMAHLLALELEHRDLQEAVHWHRIALRYGAEQPEYHLYLASALTRAGDVDSALDVYAGLSHGFLETPYEALALFHLGRLHHDYGRPEERASVDEAYHAALETLQRLRLMDPALRRGDRWDKLDELEQVVLASLAELEEEKRGEKSPVKESASNGVFSPATARRPPSSLRPTSPPLHGFRSPSAPPAVGPKSALRNGSGSASSPKRSSFRGGQRSAADSALPARQPLPDPRLYYDGHEAVLRPGGSVGYIPPEPVRPEQGRRSRAVSASRHGAGQHHRASSRTSSRTLEVIIYSLRTMADSDGPEQLYRSTRQLAEEVEETYETIKHLGQSDREKERELVGSLDELKTELEALPERLVSAAKLMSARPHGIAVPPPTQDPLRAAREKLEKARRSFLK
ncbi:hypothetical protein JCM10213_006850 [Rhodosporidiobolus nylandii]